MRWDWRRLQHRGSRPYQFPGTFLLQVLFGRCPDCETVCQRGVPAWTHSLNQLGHKYLKRPSCIRVKAICSYKLPSLKQDALRDALKWCVCAAPRKTHQTSLRIKTAEKISSFSAWLTSNTSTSWSLKTSFLEVWISSQSERRAMRGYHAVAET